MLILHAGKRSEVSLTYSRTSLVSADHRIPLGVSVLARSSQSAIPTKSQKDYLTSYSKHWTRKSSRLDAMASDVDPAESNPFWEPDDHSNMNPFENETPVIDESIDSLVVPSGNQTPVPADSMAKNSTETEEKGLSWDHIANHLLKKNFNLTALELHTELHEKGIQLPRLRDFFSNPGNFESVREPSVSDSDFFGSRLNRASSSQTLDSLDFHRESSEDDIHGRVDERVAVLEFELRKARDSIQSLREHLTNITGSPDPVLSQTSPASPKAGNPMTSTNVENAAPIQPLEKRALNFLINEYLLINDYKLTSITFTDECQNLDFDDWDDVGLNIAKPPGIVSLYRKFRAGNGVVLPTEVATPASKILTDGESQTDDNLVPQSQSNPQDSLDRMRSLEEENWRLLEENRTLRQSPSAVAEFQVPVVEPQQAPVENHVPHFDRQSPEDIHHAGSGDAVHVRTPSVHSSLPEQLTKFSAQLQRVIFPALANCDPDNIHILRTISKISLEQVQVVSLLSDSLPRIIPNVLLARRQELIPVLLVTILLHEDHEVRDTLLHQLFNLLKKPEDQQRRMILNGCERYASLAPQERLEGELLPQCWTQISHKYAERRILVAESCAVLARYVSPGMCGSLIISMLKQMMTEDKNPDVREKVVQSLGIVCLHIDDRDKFYQLSELLQICLRDSSELVVKATFSLYLPALAVWTQMYLNLGSRLLEPYFVKYLEDDNDITFAGSVAGIRKLVPNIYADVVNHGPWNNPEHDCPVDEESVQNLRARLPVATNPLESLHVLIGEDYLTSCAKFHSYIDREWFQEWPEYKWVTDVLVTSLCKCAAGIHVSKQESVMLILDLFKNMIYYFGDSFATGCISRCMKGKIQELGSSFLYHAVFVCFACAVVALCDPKQLQEFLSSALVSISDQSLPLEGLQLIFKDLCERFPEDLTQVCWIGIVHHSVPVRLNAARLLRALTDLFRKSHSHLEQLVAPLITLSSDQESRVRVEVIPSLGNLLREHIQEEKLLAIFQGFLDDRDHLDIVDHAVRNLAKSAMFMDKRFHQEFLLPRLAVLVAQNPRLQVYRKDMAICLLDAYVSISCANFGEEPWLVAPVLQSVRSLLQELKELNMIDYVDIAQELSDKLTRVNSQVGSGSVGSSDEIKAKVMSKIKDSGLTTMFKKK